MFKKISIPFLSFIQTTGLVLYILLVVSFLTIVGPKFSVNPDISKFLVPIIMLTLFIMSAIISATLVLGRAAVLFWEKKYKDSFQIILWTIIWGFTYLSIFVIYLSLFKTPELVVLQNF